MTSDSITIRPLGYSDLPQVIAIERRAFTTPWSLAMFVLELSKPSGICLAATVDDELAGYVVCSRYDQVWHLMNVAVSPDHRAKGVAGALLRRLFEEGRGKLPFTLEVRVSNHRAIGMYEYFGFRSAGVRPRYDPPGSRSVVIGSRCKSGAVAPLCSAADQQKARPDVRAVPIHRLTGRMHPWRYLS